MWIHFQTLVLTKFLMCSAISIWAPLVAGTTHIKTIFSFLTGTGSHFIGNELCSSDDSVTQLIHILHFLKINNVSLKHPGGIIQKSQIWRTNGARTTSDIFLAIMENITLRHALCKIFQSDGASHHITSQHTTPHHITSHHITSHHNTPHPITSRLPSFRVFLDRRFPDRWTGRAGPIPWHPSFSKFDSSGFFLLGVIMKSSKYEWGAWQKHQSCRVRYQYLSRNWISSWCKSCH
jgi:hypothetical protein